LRLHGDAPLQHVGQRARVPQTREQTVERAENGGVVAHPLRRRDVRSGRARRIVQLFLAGLAQANEEVGRHVGVEEGHRALLQRVGVALPPLGAGTRRKALDVVVERGVLRLLGQRAEERRLGAIAVAQRGLRHLGQGPQRLRPVGRLGLRPQAQLENRRQLLVPSRRAEHRLERVRGIPAQLVVGLADAADGGGRFLVEAGVQHFVVGVERRLRILQLHGVERGDALLQRPPGVVVGRRGRAQLEVLQQLWPQTLARVEAVEPLEHLAVARTDGQRLRQRLDGLPAVGEIVLEAPRGLDQELEAQPGVVFAAQLDPPPVKVDQPRRIVLLFVERDEVVEREGAGGLELQRPLVGLDGALQVVQHVAPGFAHPPPGAGPRLVVGHQLGLAREDAHQRGPVAEQRRQRVHLLERLQLGLVQGKEAVPRVERASRIVASLVVELRQRRQELALGEALGLGDGGLVGAGQVVPAPRGAGQAIELLARVAVVGVQRPGRAHGVEGPVAIGAARLPELRGLAQDAHALAVVRRQPQALPVELHHVPPVVGPLVDGAQDVDDARLVLRRMQKLLQRAHRLRPRPRRARRREIDHRLQLVDARLGLGQRMQEEHGQIDAKARLVLRQGRLLGASPRHVGQIAPALGASVEAGQRLQRVRVLVVHLEGRAVRLDGRRVVVKLGLFDERDGVQRGEPLAGVERVIEGVAEELHPVPRPPGLAQQPVDGLEGAVLGLGIEGVRAPVKGQRAVDVLVLLEELAGALRQARRGRFVGGDLL